MDVKPIHIVVLACGLLLLWWFGVFNIQVTTPTVTPGMVEEAPAAPTVEAAALQFTIQDAVQDSSITSANTKVDITLVGTDGTIDFMSKVEQVSVNSAPEQSTFTFGEGDTVILHVSSDVDPTSGTDHYDAWYYTTLRVGEPVRIFSPDLVTPIQTSPTYKYKFVADGPSSGYNVQYTSGTTNYWGIGALKVFPRINASKLDAYFMYGGTTISSVTDGTTWKDTAAEVSNNVTLATTDEKLWVKLDAEATNLCFGQPMYTVSSKGKIEKRVAVIIFTTDMTSIGTQKLYDKNWKSLQDSTLTSEKGFYKVIDPVQPLKGNKFTIDIEIPVDSSAASASTKYLFNIWVIDFQLEDNVKIGSVSSSVPTAYGMIGEYGLDAMLYARAYSTSSGAGTGEILTGYATTPA